jgi:para-nitrobenzyl esterase
MNKILLPFLLFILTCNSNLSAQCNGRFETEIFSNVTTESDIVYGNNINAQGTAQDLKVDIYQPTGDSEPLRPLLIMAHGGSFVLGTKTDGDVVTICNRFAKRGYVTASYEYRLGFATFLPSKPEAIRAVYRATQDAKAMVRWFWKEARNGNQYHIDTNQIFLGGSSAGAFIALHYAYLNEYNELPLEIDTSLLGDINGKSGSQGFPSSVKGIVNLCGALGDELWMNSTDVPLCSMHGTNDGTVPYATATLSLLQLFPIMTVYGSYSIHLHADDIGLENAFYSFANADHVPYAASTSYMDTTVNFVSDFLYEQLECYNSTNNLDYSKITYYPNPANNSLVVSGLSNNVSNVEVIDLTGRNILSISNGITNQLIINTDLFANGIYFLRINENSTFNTYKFIKQ